MQAKQSSTASGMYSRPGSLTPSQPSSTDSSLHDDPAASSAPLHSRSELRMTESARLIHDARNLIGAIGLYCDLLAMPGVLREEHRHYAEELRLLGTRSASLMEQMMQTSLTRSESPEHAGEEPERDAEGWSAC